MKYLATTLAISLFTFVASANQPVDDFSRISSVFVHDRQNSNARKVKNTDIEWIIGAFQACSWREYQRSLDLQRYVFSFFDGSEQLMMSGQLVDGNVFMSAGEGIFVCAIPAGTAQRILQLR